MTLTYPHEYPEDPEVCKNHLKALRRRLQRKFGEFASFWRLGIQRRGAWHFHLASVVGPSFGPIDKLRRFISSSWYEVTGKVSEGHLRAGTVSKPSEMEGGDELCRALHGQARGVSRGTADRQDRGVWNEELLPVQWETVEVSLRDAFKIRRVYRKLARRRVAVLFTALRCS